LIISPSPVEKEAREQGRRFRWGHLNENYLTGVATQTLRFTAGVRGHFPLQELPLCSAGILKTGWSFTFKILDSERTGSFSQKSNRIPIELFVNKSKLE
jgi:hypothetical protein